LIILEPRYAKAVRLQRSHVGFMANIQQESQQCAGIPWVDEAVIP
jgi:hypothetical protein